MSEETSAQSGGTAPASPETGAPSPDAAAAESSVADAATRSSDTPTNGTNADGASAQTDAASGDASSADSVELGPDGTPKRKRKRRRRRKKKPEGEVATQGAPAQGDGSPAPAPKRRPTSDASSDVAASMASMASGLFSHLDDRAIVCRLDSCTRTWVWTADEQIRNFGQPPPRRLCPEHASHMDSIADTPVACANPGCERTWLWSKGARSAQVQRGGGERAPRRVCEQCQAEEKALEDRAVTCRVDGCKRTWAWDRDSQLKHRTWLRRSGDEAAAESPGRGRGRGRRRKRTRGSIHEPPARMCEPCRAKLAKLTDRENSCKVHGCTRMAKVDRDTQLRAWAALGTEDLEAEAPSLPRRMCEVCREFCKNHPDRKIACGRPGCDKSWSFKTGGQLQAFLAGRHEDPVRLCAECSKGDFTLLERPAGAPQGAEVMPCVVVGCDAVWYWLPGTQLSAASAGEQPTDRMCAEHRAGHVTGGAAEPAPKATESPAPAADPKPTVDAKPAADPEPAADAKPAASDNVPSTSSAEPGDASAATTTE